MIKWHCNFNIPESSVQLSDALIKVQHFTNIIDSCEVNIVILSEEGEVIKEETHEYNRLFSDENDIYAYLLTQFDNSELIAYLARYD